MESINRPELVKEHNLNLVREKLFEARQATRQQLSAMTGISTVTLGNLLQQLVTNGEALETDTLQPASGRPARVYSYNDRRLLGLLVSVIFTEGRDQFQASLVNLYGEVVWEDRSPAACLDPQGTQRYFDRLLHLRGPVGAIAIGLPGIGFRGYLRRENKP